MGTNLLHDTVKYLNESVWAKIAPSPLGGVGVFAIRDIRKGTRVSDFLRFYMARGEIFSVIVNDFMKIEKPIRDLILDKSMFLDEYIFNFMSPNCECFLQDFTNHSETPNVTTEYIANRDIKEGEEILEDYREFQQQQGRVHDLVREHLKDICNL